MKSKILKSIKKNFNPKKLAKSNSLYTNVLIKNFNKKKFYILKKIKQQNVLEAFMTILTTLTSPNFKKYNFL